MSMMSMNSNSNINKEKNKIINIPNIDIFTNGNIEEFKNLKKEDINIIGNVVDENNNIISEINPMIMVINQYSSNYKEKINILINNGGDFNKKINYYGKEMSAHDIDTKYRY
mgnify:CR=1 FL=1